MGKARSIVDRWADDTGVSFFNPETNQWEDFNDEEPIDKSDRYDDIEHIEKFNPYHDAKGRFAEANGFMNSNYTGNKKRQAVTFSADPKTRAGAMAIARASDPNTGHEVLRRAYGDVTIPDKAPAKPKAPKKPEKPEEPQQPKKTLAGVEQGEPMTREQANEGHVNPGYKSLDNGYHINCQSCVVAYEARLRGYDVTAKSRTNNPTASDVAFDTSLPWIDPATGKKPKYIVNENANTAKKYKAFMEETIKPGERYTFQHGWKGNKHSGHIISADRDEAGNLRLYDPQSGETMKGAQIDEYLKKTKLTSKVYGFTIPRAKMLRVDNLEFRPDIAKGIMEAAKK